MDKSQIKTVYESRFIKLYDMEYEKDRHYLVASRKKKEDLPALASAQDYKKLVPDAVSCIVVLKIKGEEPRLLLSYEYRYPAGQFLLSVPAGLIDEEDKKESNPIVSAAIRELKEETGVDVLNTDVVKVVNPYLFSTPGMTDESNGLVYCEIHREYMPTLSQDGAVGSEKFHGFKLLTKKDAEKLLCDGRDENGIYYPIWTWAALMFFIGV